ncbi:hypothetical protein IAU59_007369 [Kwoniella sp. CBS 9459]
MSLAFNTAKAFANEQGNLTDVQITQAAEAVFQEHQNLNLGALVFGMIVDSILCGVMLAQLSHYFTHSADDRFLVKSIVSVSAVFGLAGTAFIFFLNCHFFVGGFGTYTRFLQLNYSPWFAFLGIVPSVAVQTFFANRAYNLTSKSKILAGVLAVMIVVSLVGAIGTIPASANMAVSSEASIRQNVEVFMFLWLLGGSSANILITGFIMKALLSTRSEYHESNRTIKRLMRLIIETQLPPTILLLCFLIVYRVSTDSFLFYFFEWVSPKAYICGLLASLNSRHALRRTIGSENTSSKKGSSYQLDERSPAVHVRTETIIQDDNVSPALPGLLSPPTAASAAMPQSRNGLAQVPYAPRDFDYPSRTGGGGFRGAGGNGLSVGFGFERDDDLLGDKVELENGRGKRRDTYIP